MYVTLQAGRQVYLFGTCRAGVTFSGKGLIRRPSIDRLLLSTSTLQTITSYAKDDGVHTLYRFVRYPADGNAPAETREARRRVDDLLLRGKLYFALPPELNDPFEASPALRPLKGTAEEQFAHLAGSLRKTWAPKWGWSEQQILQSEMRLRQEIEDGTLEQRRIASQAASRAMLHSQYPMCCVSAVRDSILMWSYYAAGHTGMCIHFDATKAPFALAQRVVYADEYPQLPWPPDVAPEVARTILALTKSSVWRHEQEYRVINMPTRHGSAERVFDDLYEWKTRQLMVLPRHLIVGVTVGAAMPSAEIDSILRVCYNRGARIPVYRARCHPERYELQFERIS